MLNIVPVTVFVSFIESPRSTLPGALGNCWLSGNLARKHLIVSVWCKCELTLVHVPGKEFRSTRQYSASIARHVISP